MTTYVDAGHSAWVPVDQIADLLDQVGVDRSAASAPTSPTTSPLTPRWPTPKALSDRVGGAHFVIDTGRNGIGGDRLRTGATRRVRRSARLPGRWTTAVRSTATSGSSRQARATETCHGGPAAGRALAGSGCGARHRGRVVIPKRHVVLATHPKIARVTPEPRYAVVIEDDPDTSRLIDMVLTQSGFTVITAIEGLAGIEAVRKYDPLLTTLDVQMPGMDGIAVAKRLREFSLTYLIMLTSMAGEIDIIQGFEAGADDYLVKPFRPRELRARADAMLRRMRIGTPAAPAPAAKAPDPEPESWTVAAARELRENPLAPSEALVQPRRPHRPDGPVTEPAAAAPRTRQLPPSLPEPSVASGTSVATVTGLLEYADLALDSETGRTTYRGRSLDLTPEEFDLLNTLLHTGRRVRSKADLVLALRGHVTSHFVNEADKREVDAHIAHPPRQAGRRRRAAARDRDRARGRLPARAGRADHAQFESTGISCATVFVSDGEDRDRDLLDDLLVDVDPGTRSRLDAHGRGHRQRDADRVVGDRADLLVAQLEGALGRGDQHPVLRRQRLGVEGHLRCRDVQRVRRLGRPPPADVVVAEPTVTCARATPSAWSRTAPQLLGEVVGLEGEREVLAAPRVPLVGPRRRLGRVERVDEVHVRRLGSTMWDWKVPSRVNCESNAGRRRGVAGSARGRGGGVVASSRAASQPPDSHAAGEHGARAATARRVRAYRVLMP